MPLQFHTCIHPLLLASLHLSLVGLLSAVQLVRQLPVLVPALLAAPQLGQAFGAPENLQFKQCESLGTRSISVPRKAM